MNIIKLGGSLVNPNGLYDDKLLSKLVKSIGPKEKYLFVVGGGFICRQTQDATVKYLQKALPKSQLNNARDEIGIAVTKINAWYVLEKFKKKYGDKVFPKVLINPTFKHKTRARIFVAGGWRPGHSTDMDMMLFAKSFKANHIYKISNFPFVKRFSPIEFAKSKNKKKLIKEAEDIKQISWKELQDLVGHEWAPGLNTPFDPSAVKVGVSMRKNLVAYIGPINQFFNSIKGKKFVGTVVKG